MRWLPITAVMRSKSFLSQRLVMMFHAPRPRDLTERVFEVSLPCASARCHRIGSHADVRVAGLAFEAVASDAAVC